MRARQLSAERRLSRSPLWRLQRAFFERQGIRAWTEATVPHYITSNPWIADAYAKVVFGWLRDWTAPPGPGMEAAPLDRAAPVHVVELGCGPGRFGYLFLRRLLDRLERSHLRGLSVRYVLTDFTESTLDHLRSHPALQPLVAAGALDFACLDLGQETLRLSHSGEVLRPGSVQNPIAVLANYVFDSLPQDCFEVRGGRLHEHLVRVSPPASGQPGEGLDDPALLAALTVSSRRRRVRGAPYGDPDLDRILGEYQERLEGATFLFPVAALRGLRALARLAGGRLLLLSGDKGSSREEALRLQGGPVLTLHGSFSLPVDHHAIGRWFLHQGGACLHTSHLRPSLDVTAGLLGTPPGGHVETRLAFDDAVERAGPDDFFAVHSGIAASLGAFSLEQILAWLRLSGWDPQVLARGAEALQEKLPAATAEELRELRDAVHRIWDGYFPLRERRDLAFELGALLCAMEEWADALAFFDRSEALHGPNPATAFNQALCLFRLGDREAARARAEETLAAAPDLPGAAELLEQILAPEAPPPAADRRTSSPGRR